MIYRELGHTGLEVSRLGFGAMRLPMTGEGTHRRVDRELAIPMIHRAFESGVNYIDTAVGYCEQDSQRAVGEALEEWRGRIIGRPDVCSASIGNPIVSTKNPYYGPSEKEWRRNLENSLERLRIEVIDIYNFHGINWKTFREDVEPRVGGWMRKAKDSGLIRHICCSFHDTNDALKNIVDTGMFESITLQYNMLDRRLEEGIAYAHGRGIGVVVMGPVGGGRLGEPSAVLDAMLRWRSRIPETALRFVLANPCVDCAISGMSTKQQVEENIAVACDPEHLTPEFMEEIRTHLVKLKNMADLYCTGCSYCMPCPQGVSIPRIFELYNQARVYDIHQVSRAAYELIGKVPWEPGKKADACVECGECEPKCPQHIEIRKQLADARRVLENS